MKSNSFKPLDNRSMRTQPIREKNAKVDLAKFASIYEKGSGISGLIKGLPQILAGRDFCDAVEAIVQAKKNKRAIIWGLGGHVVKCGLNSVLIDLMDRGFISALVFNGATAIHDFEIAMVGSTSEDVEKGLPTGDFGTSEETSHWMNDSINKGVSRGKGIGKSLGESIIKGGQRFPHAESSLLASAIQKDIPVTIHVAIGTDTIHTHPSADGSALGKGSLQDFRLLASIICRLHNGGVYLNCGSAVVLPEIFLKAVSLVRNLGHPLEKFTTVNLDFLQHYRPTQNVIKRPTLGSGQGISLTGHHELMIPLLAATLIEASDN